MTYRVQMLAQLLGSVAILAFVPGNAVKLVAFLAWWTVTFRRLTPREWGLAGAALILFTLLDYQTLRQGIFHFEHPDFLLMPCYEPLLWPYLLVHVLHTVGGPVPGGSRALALAFALVFALPFLLLTHVALLLATTTVLLAIGLVLDHDRQDLAYVSYFVLLGVLWEYAGVWSGQWSYPGPPLTGVPPWFATLFGGMGLILRLLPLPLRQRPHGPHPQPDGTLLAARRHSQACHRSAPDPGPRPLRAGRIGCPS